MKIGLCRYCGLTGIDGLCGRCAALSLLERELRIWRRQGRDCDLRVVAVAQGWVR